MINYERMMNEKLYQFDDELLKIGLNARRLLDIYNTTPHKEFEKRRQILKELFSSVGDGANVQAPFYCDYGVRISMGKNSFVNWNCTFLDQGGITIGDNVLIGPNVGLYTPVHPIDPDVRKTGLELGKPIVIKENVWIGGSVIVNPGVTIGENSIIGSGSLVTKDIPANVIAFGQPCRVIKKISDSDREYWKELQNDYENDLKKDNM